ncbi:hypothetical protein [Janthinobacterium sp. UMAB-56]|uniref:hypothetical protein n=1 Tax=Janthinobacterium sp. UMAB-56 TaxID=1365361 RepID=UPI001C5793B7|nr:hypothetical protein [Janthinobacterium sp. UMAB-56]
MKFITAIIANIRTLLGSLVQPAAPVATVTAPHIRMLLLHLCDQDEAKALWLARWLAYPLRNRGAKMRTAILTTNKDGAGHLLFEQVIGPMYGNQAQLGGVLPRRTFNAWAIGKRYAGLSDLKNSDLDTACVKNLITSSNIVVHRHGLPDIAISNSLNVVFMTGAREALSPDNCDRRFFVLNPKQALPVALAAAVVHEIENGGLIEFNHFLMHELDMSSFDACSSTSYAPAPGRPATALQILPSTQGAAA